MSKIYDQITEKIISNLEKGCITWRKPWSGSPSKNFVSGNYYTGINALLTNLSNYGCPEWITFLQAKELGISIKKGERSTPIIFVAPVNNNKIMIDEESKEELVSYNLNTIVKHYNIFNLEQTDFDLSSIDYKKLDFKPIEECEKIVKNYKNCPEIIIEGYQANYVINFDLINMPAKERFSTIEDYYSTLFHELTHSTAHKDRLNREIKSLSKDNINEYSGEELITEIGSSFLCSIAGISNNVIENQSSYIDGWIKVLKENSSFIISSASKAQKAVNFILGGTK